jgi:FKBP-type peptidyl-prolyl cis-trans isomerase 2
MRFLEVELGFKKQGEPLKKSIVCVVTGEQALPKPLDEALEKAGVGVESTVTLNPENSFGFRKPELVKIVSLNKFKKQKINPAPGMILFFDGAPGKIKSVSGGRAVVDFNPELAGETLECSYKILREFKTEEEKLKGFGEKLGEVTIKNDSVTVKTSNMVTEEEKQKFKLFVEKHSKHKKVEFE